MSREHKLYDRRPAKKRFVTARDVHEMAAAGTRELATGPDIVITEAAREAAIDHGIRLVPESARIAAVAPPMEIVDAIVEAFRRSGQLDPSEREVREVAKRVLSAGIGRGK